MTLLLIGMLTLAFNIQPATASLPVHNIDTGKDFATIQAAIDDSDTLDGHTILVDAGIYYEHVDVDKTVSLIGTNRNTTIIDGIVDGIGIVVSVSADNVVVRNFTVQNGEFGIACMHTGALIDSNIITNCSQVGLGLIGGTNNIVVNNAITNSRYGIHIIYSGSNVLKGNNMEGNSYNFGVFGHVGETPPHQEYIQDIDTSNMVDGKPIYYWVNQANKEVPSDAGYVGLVNSTSIIARDLNISKNCEGVLLAYATNCTIENVSTSQNEIAGIHLFKSNNIIIRSSTMTSNGASPLALSGGVRILHSSNSTLTGNILMNNFEWGIILESSSNITVSENKITNGYEGIRLDHSTHNSISGNNITANEYAGIVLWHPSDFNSISGNNITNNGHGIELYDSSNNTISGNHITDNSLHIYLCSSSNNTVSGNNFTNSLYGIHLWYSSNNMVSSNHITNNSCGIRLCDSSNNTVSGNNITNTKYYGIRLEWSSNNSIYHNNFINNTHQVYSYNSRNVWDDGYPSGGNYWSDYKKRYPHAKELDRSGIWDTPYVIDGDNHDNFPLIKPWTRPQYELFFEIDYMTGHKPTESVLTYIKTYYLQRSIDVMFYVDDEVAFDSEVTETEFFIYEATYNDLGDDQIVDGNKVLTSKWKWVLFGTVDEDGANGYTYATTEAGNYIFVADETNDDWANEWINKYIWGITEEEVETVVLMHEMGHDIGILKLDKPGTDPDRDGTPEDYDNAKWSVMARLSRHNCNANPIRYSQSYWNLRNMEYYEI